MNAEGVKDIKNRLKSGKNYLKSDFKVHVIAESPCDDHCRVFALSTAEPEYHGDCLHKHDLCCDRCEGLKRTILELELFISSKQNQLRYVISSHPYGLAATIILSQIGRFYRSKPHVCHFLRSSKSRDCIVIIEVRMEGSLGRFKEV